MRRVTVLPDRALPGRRAALLAWLLASAGGCLNPRPEELPSYDESVAATPEGSAGGSTVPGTEMGAPSGAPLTPVNDAPVPPPISPPEPPADLDVPDAGAPADAGARSATVPEAGATPATDVSADDTSTSE